MKLLRVAPLEEAIEQLYKESVNGGLCVQTELCPISDAGGRVLAQDVYASEDVPGFFRSTVDGVAVRSRDTGGASEGLPAFLKRTDEIEMGRAASRRLHAGECQEISTGGMLPDGADAVVMIENTEQFTEEVIGIYEAVASGWNTIGPSDDCRKGQRVLRAGRTLRSSDIGLCSALGIGEVSVCRPWRIALFSTGDELVPTEQRPAPGQIRDVNSAALDAETRRQGFSVTGCRLIADQPELLREGVRAAMNQADFVVISGGSSKGKKDSTAQIIDELASTGAFTHGIAVRPGKPTILGFDAPTRTGLIGLPGHPVAALLLFRLIVGELWVRYTGGAREAIPHGRWGKMAVNVAASPGRKTFQLVRFREDGLVVPVLGASGLIRTMSEADGYIVLEINDEGVRADESVWVYAL